LNASSIVIRRFCSLKHLSCATSSSCRRFAPTRVCSGFFLQDRIRGECMKLKPSCLSLGFSCCGTKSVLGTAHSTWCLPVLPGPSFGRTPTRTLRLTSKLSFGPTTHIGTKSTTLSLGIVFWPSESSPLNIAFMSSPLRLHVFSAQSRTRCTRGLGGTLCAPRGHHNAVLAL
jgi:hypothetical protein